MGLLLSHCLCCFGQEFEVASIKPSPEINSSKGPVFFGSRGGPGTESPARYWCNFCEVLDLVSQAYDVPEYRIVSTKRLPTDRFHVVATIAPGTTRAQFQLMLQNLLIERFGLKIYHDKRESRAYQLLISRQGAKLKPHVEGPPVEAKSTGEKALVGYHYRTQATLADFAKVIENQLQKPVVDATGLAGKYDFDLSWSDGDLDAAEQSRSDLPTLLSAIRSLGLEIDSRKEQIDVIVIDDIAKSPTKD
jgi:uncharacterized protein (TIGR03435 family)